MRRWPRGPRIRPARPHDDRGDVTLPGLLCAVVSSLVVLVGVLNTFGGAEASSTELTARNANQQAARQISDQLAVALRNLASPTPDQPQAIDRAGPYDLIFQDVDPNGPNNGANTTNVRRERWCLDAAGTLYAQQQTWTTAAVPATPAAVPCPGAGWQSTNVLIGGIANRVLVPAVPLFTFDAVTLTDIAAVHVDLTMDEDPLRPPAAVRVDTGVFLRNQNRRPTASFTAVPTAQGIVLNASASMDPEGQPLTYEWYDGATMIDTGVTSTYVVTHGTSHALSVRVLDPAGLTATAPTQTVVG
ncbi:MAG: hypothetical protein JWM31_788 [Solirubrobacterales bacterium]|nr:hypothetical protein [Solirubrobacterales bacterium]